MATKRWQAVCTLDEIPQEAGIGARLGGQHIALFRFGKAVYALEDREPGGSVSVLSRGILGDAGGEPVVISPAVQNTHPPARRTAGRYRRSGGTRLASES
ncbi:Nitrite reductase [NAD(P)H] small subunit [Leclercia adecarboxylata]|uniref:Nitrite reductase [NAD(P)H] small subunit n=1 Tax=Leclercia adecarboxylata TaxID=83655 RepID=A0A4U9HZ18_9ENTR|nr:Nitrite reductase [NAD(P)H] small subunit [Leclercia adecarboxylata]